MKKVLLIVGVLLLVLSCTMNPSKESRLQQLETELLKTSQKVQQLEKRIDSLEVINSELNTQMLKQSRN